MLGASKGEDHGARIVVHHALSNSCVLLLLAHGWCFWNRKQPMGENLGARLGISLPGTRARKSVRTHGLEGRFLSRWRLHLCISRPLHWIGEIRWWN